MVEFYCEKCNKKFIKKSTYITHISRKNPCIPPEYESNYKKLEKRIEELEKKIELLLLKT